MNKQELRQTLSQLRAEGAVLSKEYLKFAKEKLGMLSVYTPFLWKRVMEHRYLLPGRIQQDYASQEACDYMLLEFLISYTAPMFPMDDNVVHVTYMNHVRALEFDRPIYFLERPLAEALLRTDVPLDLQVDDIHWIYPQFRVYLPNNLLAITRKGNQNPVMYLDICKADEGFTYSMPPQFVKELQLLGCRFFPAHEAPKDSFILNVHLHFDCDESNINYAVTSPWEGQTMRKMLEIGNKYELTSDMPSDDLDHEFMSRAVCLAMNIMLRLSSLPTVVQDGLRRPPVPIRKPTQKGRRSIVGLYPAKIIGMDEAVLRPKSEAEPAEPTGKHLVAHWRRGHWRRQPYGPKMGLRRFQWIAPYHTT